MSWYVIANLFGASQTLLLACVLLVVKQGNRFANLFLMTLLAVAATGMLAHAYSYGRNPISDPLPFMLTNLNFALGPLLFYYTKALTEGYFSLRPKMLLHLLPVPVMMIYLWIRLSLYGAEIAASDLWQSGELIRTMRETGFSTLIFLALLMGYSWLSLRLIRKHQVTIHQQFSAVDQIKLNWLANFFYVCLAVGAIEAVLQLLRLQGDYGFRWRIMIQLAGSLVMLYFLFFMALRQRLIFSDEDERIEPSATAEPKPVVSEAPSLSNEPPKYQTSSLERDDAEVIWARLRQLMVEERAFLINGLKIGQLANMAGYSVDHVSQSISLCGEQNFFDFVNHYRIEEAARLLREEPNLSISQIAEESGFNSQSTFYTQFKKYYDQTPRQFRKQLGQ